MVIAVAQALMVTRHMDSFNGIPLEYDRLIKVKSYVYDEKYPSEVNIIARLIYEIGKSIGTKYSKNGSISEPTNAIKFFTEMGNKMQLDKKPSSIRKTLKNYPNGIVLVDSRTKKSIFGKIRLGDGHMYIADGYKIFSDGSDLIHINFGHGLGKYNGYFLTNLTAPIFTQDSPGVFPCEWNFYCLYK